MSDSTPRSSMSTVNRSRFTVDEFVTQCQGALGEGEPHLAIRDVLARTVNRPKFVEAGLGTRSSWCLETLHHAPDLTILHIVWPPWVDLFAHDHQMWAAIGIYGGVETNTYYRRNSDSLEVTGSRDAEAGDVLMLGSQAIHSVSNPTRQWTAALHVYGGDFFNEARTQWGSIDRPGEPFDAESTRAVLAAADQHAKDYRHSL
jgi:predicted metal-dependent enzyme (double-stranded beta helix superfamily)